VFSINRFDADGDGDGGTPMTRRHGGRLDAAGAAGLLRQPDSHRGVSIEEIARLAGHASTRTTEIVYRDRLPPRSAPRITAGAEIMDQIFAGS
jgi:integrase